MEFTPQKLVSVGNTPLVALSSYAPSVTAEVYLKNEAVNSTGSVSDRLVPTIISVLEKNNVFEDNKTLVLALSGMIAISIASFLTSSEIPIIAVLTDKESTSKVNILKALGCEVVICPYELAQSHYKSQFAVAQRLQQRSANTFLIDDSYYAKFSEAYSQTLASELYEQMEGKLDHIILPISSDAVLLGVSKFFKEKKLKTKIWGVDAYGSIIKKYYDTGIMDNNEVYPNILEGVGAVSINASTKLDDIDGIVKVSDKQAVLECVKLARNKGLLLGFCSGAALAAIAQLKTNFQPAEKVVVIAMDTGLYYHDKIYNENWRRSLGFVNKPVSVASDLVKNPTGDLISVKTSELVTHAVARMRKHKISQIPVIDAHGFVGSVDEMSLFKAYLEDQRKEDTPVSEIMNPPFPMVNSFATVAEIASLIRKGHNAVIVALDNEKHGIITKSDVISHIQ